MRVSQERTLEGRPFQIAKAAEQDVWDFIFLPVCLWQQRYCDHSMHLSVCAQDTSRMH